MKRALYFGYSYGGGHFLHSPDSICSRYPEKIEGFPWSIKHLDTGLLKNGRVPDSPDGRVHWTCGGDPLWFAFFWWDRSGDKRPGSNSGFYVRGFGPTELTRASINEATPLAFAYGCEQWPDVIARQHTPLVLVVNHVKE